jgi:hypothetical protein
MSDLWWESGRPLLVTPGLTRVRLTFAAAEHQVLGDGAHMAPV